MPHRIALGTPISHRPDSDNDAEASVQKELNQEKPAKAARCVIKGGRGTLQVMRTGQPDQPITKILALKQNEDDKNDDDARCCERMEQRRNKALQTLQRAWIGLTDFHGNGFGRRRLSGLRPLPARSPPPWACPVPCSGPSACRTRVPACPDRRWCREMIGSSRLSWIDIAANPPPVAPVGWRADFPSQI